ncbi:MAG: hypothetical protein ACI4AB_10695 [Acetatifactor sp.]
MIKEIKKKRLRYIVPFAFEAGEQEVAGLCEKLTGNSGEVNWVYEPPKEKEQDIYQLFEDTFRPNRRNHENIGFSLKLTGQDATGEILRIRYRRGDELPEYGFHISEAGLYLFRTGIGLFWYEIQENAEQETSLDMEELILFQNRFKELNSSVFFWYDDKNPKYSEDGSKKPNYVAEFLLEQKEAGCTLGYWIKELLDGLGCEINFYPNRKYCKNPEILVPDKAILFSYLVGEAENEEDIEEAAYYLSSGYNRTYLMPEDIREKMFRPFRGAYWYATKEGCGYYVQNHSVNEFFFSNYMPNKIASDYFVLYILLLYQSYSLLHYANKIEKDMSADFRVYKDAAPGVAEWLEEFETEINVFLIKSVYASVSHIQHQNGFYEYVSKQLRIREDIDSLTLGLRSLDELQQMRQRKRDEEQEEKLSTALGVLSLLAIISGFSDGFGFVDQMTVYFRGTGWTGIDYVTHIGIFILVLLIAFFAVKSVGKVLVRMTRDEIRKRRERKNK